MGYTKQNFADGQTLKAEHLIKMEEGIINAEKSGGSGTVDSALNGTSTNPVQNKVVKSALDKKQDKLVSGTSIKTVNGQSLLGSGDITIEGGDITVQGGNDGAQWAGKTWYAYGTSLTATNKYTKTVQELSGLTLVNKGISGGGISAGSKAVKSAIMKTTDGKLNADLITLEVGANDASTALGDIYDTSDSTFCGNLNQCIRYLQENTEAQIVVLSSTNAKRNTSSNTEATPEVEYGSDSHTKYDQWKATEEVAKINSVYYIPMGEGAGLGYARMNSKYLSDAIHHTDLGGKNLGSFVWSQLKNIPRWYASSTDEEDTTVFYTITYNYVDSSGIQIKPSTEVKTTAGTEFTFDTASAESIDGYEIVSVSPSGTVTINSDTAVTFIYEPIANVTYHTVTYKYVDAEGNTLKSEATSSVAEGVTLNLTTSNAPNISGYKISSVTPNGSLIVSGDIVVTYVYNAIVYRTVTYAYVDEMGASLQDSTTAQVIDGTQLTFATSNAPKISGYAVASVAPSGATTITSDLTVTYTYKVSEAVSLNDDITWYGKLAGGGDFQVFWDTSSMDVLNTDITANERSVGIVDVSAYQGQELEMTYSQNYASAKPNGGYAVFLSGGDKPSSAKTTPFKALLSYVIERWNNCTKSDFVNVTTNVTITKTIPSNAKWLVFQHVQTSVADGFNGKLEVI